LFFTLVRSSRPGLFVEVGAHRAEASRRYKRMVPDGRAVAFEANPVNFERFRGLFGNGAGAVDYRNLAVSDHDGKVTFKIVAELNNKTWSPGEGRHSLMARNVESVTYSDVEVDAVTLDSFFADQGGGGAAVWIDVEGAVGKVLAGAPRFLNEAKIVLVEVEDVHFWEDQWLAGRVTDHLLSHGLIPIARDFESPNGYQYNMLFVRPETFESYEINSAMIKYISRMARKGGAETAEAPAA
jgi:FkbM family methyltransferase